MSLDAMKQALEALEECTAYTSSESWSPSMTRECEAAITALRAAIEQALEPVAWQVMVEDEAMKEFPIKDMAHDWCAKQKLSGSPSAYWIRPLYTAPCQWQGLTDEELNQIYAEPQTHAGQYARAIEAKLREKNT